LCPPSGDRKAQLYRSASIRKQQHAYNRDQERLIAVPINEMLTDVYVAEKSNMSLLGALEPSTCLQKFAKCVSRNRTADAEPEA
jgi:hypothetical protein